jgi:4-hydroxybenzoate polyprenyltransferase
MLKTPHPDMVTVKKYLSLIKFSHTIFAMPFALIGFALGIIYSSEYSITSPNSQIPKFSNQQINISTQTALLLLLVILCMVFARSAAMAFNRYLDRHFDAKNPRTAIREIPAGILRAENVLWFTIINSLLFIITTLFINRLCFYLSPVALAVVLGYSYTKRFTPLCHLVLGVGLSLAPIGAFLAVTGEFQLLPLLFSFAVICWVSGFDIIYALQDEEFDRTEKLYSIPAWLGKAAALRVSRVFHVCSAIFVILAGWFGGLGILYWLAVAVFAGMLIYQQSIVKPNDLRKVNLAFMTANGIASVVFAILAIVDLLIRRIV